MKSYLITVLIGILYLLVIVLPGPPTASPPAASPPDDCNSPIAHSPRELYECFKRFAKEDKTP